MRLKDAHKDNISNISFQANKMIKNIRADNS